MDEDTLVVGGGAARVLIDALPYLDSEYDNPVVQAQVRPRPQQPRRRRFMK